MQEVLRERATIEYDQDIRGVFEEGGHKTKRIVAVIRYECEVEVIVELHNIIRHMGATACRSRTGKCQDGYVTVKRRGNPKELLRETKAMPQGDLS